MQNLLLWVNHLTWSPESRPPPLKERPHFGECIQGWAASSPRVISRWHACVFTAGVQFVSPRPGEEESTCQNVTKQQCLVGWVRKQAKNTTLTPLCFHTNGRATFLLGMLFFLSELHVQTHHPTTWRCWGFTHLAEWNVGGKNVDAPIAPHRAMIKAACC